MNVHSGAYSACGTCILRTCTYACIHTCMYAHIDVYIYVCIMYKCTYACIHTCMYAHTYVYIYVCIMYKCTYACIHTCMYADSKSAQQMPHNCLHVCIHACASTLHVCISHSLCMYVCMRTHKPAQRCVLSEKGACPQSDSESDKFPAAQHSPKAC
jgi:hypothetical protein